MIAFLFALTLAVLVALCIYVAAQAIPSQRAVRVRNALLLQPSTAADFEWMPPQVPADFATEQVPADRVFADALKAAGVTPEGDDWTRALLLASHLAKHAQDRGPIRDEPVITYRRILEGYGYCSDYVKVYLVLLGAAQIFARQWSFSFDDFGGHGHTLLEIFDRQRRRWQMVDVYNNFHVVDAATALPLSALEFRAAIFDGRAIRLVPNGPGRPGFVEEHKALEYYRRGTANWYMWWGNAVLARYKHPVVRTTHRFSRSLSGALATLFGDHRGVRIFPSFERTQAGLRLMHLRTRLRAMALAGAMLGVALLVEGLVLWSRGGHP